MQIILLMCVKTITKRSNILKIEENKIELQSGIYRKQSKINYQNKKSWN
jgi:hypothetical protein